MSAKNLSQSEVKELAWDIMNEEIDELYEKFDLDEVISKDEIHMSTARWKRRNGVARYHREPKKTHAGQKLFTDRKMGEHMIAANRKMIEQDLLDEFRDTIRHELAHIIDYVDNGTSDHSERWKSYAAQFNAETESCHDKVSTEEYKYAVICGNGCYERGFHLKSKTVKHPEWYSCRECGETLERVDPEKVEGL